MDTNEENLKFSAKENLIKVEQQLDDYIASNYDLENDKYSLKYIHTFKTKRVSDEICSSLSLNQRDTYIAGVIALFHDYARFEQFRLYGTYSDANSVDHGDLAIELLFDKGELFNFITDLNEEELNLVKLAIKNHNKYAVEEGLTERQLLFCNIIRDADKVDIYRILSQDARCISFEEGHLKEEELKNFYDHKLYKRSEKPIDFYDRIIMHLSYIYDLNFKQSFKILKKEKYIKKYMYSMLLGISFKIDDELINCFNYIEKYIKEKSI